MRIPVLVDLQQELNRLYIAGSKFAPNDPRLKKLVPTLDAMAQKAPIFKKISENLTALIESNEQESAQRLFEVGNLLYAILYTQADQIIESTAEQKEFMPLVSLNNSTTRLKYSQLKPVIEALSQSNPGRYEIIREAFESKLLLDSRFYPYVAKAVNDKYAELSFYIIHTVIPAIGTPIVPFMLNQVTYEDNSSNIKTVEALYNAGYPQLLEILDKIVEKEDTTKLLGTALRLYKAFPVREEVLYKYTTNKNASVREGAFHALAQLNTEKSIEHLMHLLDTKKTAIYQEAILKELAEIREKRNFVSKYFNLAKEGFYGFFNKMTDKNQANNTAIDYNTFSHSIALLNYDESEETIQLLTDSVVLLIEHYKKFNYEIHRVLEIINKLPVAKRKGIFETIEKRIANQPYFVKKNSELERYYVHYLSFCIQVEMEAGMLYDKFSPIYTLGLIDVYNFERIFQSNYMDGWKDLIKQTYKLSAKWYPLLKGQYDAELKLKNSYRKVRSFQSIIFLMIHFQKPMAEIEKFIKDNSTKEVTIDENTQNYLNEYKAAK